MEENICGLDDGDSPWVLNASRKVKLCASCSFDFLQHLVAPLAINGPQLRLRTTLCALMGGTWHGSQFMDRIRKVPVSSVTLS